MTTGTRAAAQATHFEYLYRHLFARTSTLAVLHDANGRILEANPAAVARLGYTREELRQRYIADFVVRVDERGVAHSTSHVMAHGSLDAPAILQNRQGELLSVNATLRKLEISGNPVVHWMAEPAASETSEDEPHERLVELNTIFSLSPNGLALIGPDQRVQVANPAFARFLERNVGQVIGMTLGDIEAELNGRAAEHQEPLALGHWDEPSPEETLISPAHQSIRLQTPKSRTVKVQHRTLGSGAEGETAILSLQDITREDEVDQMKTRFLSAAAHELRNPMATISGFADLLDSTPQDSEVFTEIVQTIRSQADAMSTLVNELLDLTRMGTLGKRDLELDRLDVAEWLAKTARQFRRPQDDRTVTPEVVGELPRVTADKAKLTRALTNVLSNAFKYSNTDAPVALRAWHDMNGIHVSVADQGIGMKEEDVARICDPFFRANAARSMHGTGLGMSLVAEIMNAHGGQLDIESRAGIGTTVTLTLPA